MDLEWTPVFVRLLETNNCLQNSDPALFRSLAAQSANLSTSSMSLYDALSGCGLPGDIDAAQAVPIQRPVFKPIIHFTRISDEEVSRIREDLVL